MSFLSSNNPCLCESGLDYLYCCGAPDRKELNIVACIASDESEVLQQLPIKISESFQDMSVIPDWFPVKIDLPANKIVFVKMSPFWYEESVFLDAGRILGTYAVEMHSEFAQEKLQNLEWLYSPIIFHTAFCGSTLLSKVLSQAYNTLPLREPDLLGSLFSAVPNDFISSEQYVEWVMGLLTRRYESDQPVIIKANDYANGLMRKLLENKTQAPALFMYVPLNEFLAGCLKDSGRRQWIAERYVFVKNKLADIFPELDGLNIGEGEWGKMAAVYWSYNISLYLQAYQTFPDRIRCLDFNQMLAMPEQTIEACAHWFDLKPLSGVSLSGEIKSLFNVYSKGGQEYNKNKRREDIDSVLQENIEHLSMANACTKELIEQYALDVGLPGQLYTPEVTVKPRGIVKRFFLGAE